MSIVIRLTEAVTLSTYITSLELQLGDLILIEHPRRPMQNDSLCELIITDTNWSTSPADLDLLTLPPENWIFLHMAALSNRVVLEPTMESLRLAPHIPRDRTIDAGAIVTFRPSTKAIRDSIFSGICPYERCQHGMVLVSPSSCDDLGLMKSSREAHLTFCPFCVEVGILRQHEGLVRGAGAMMLESATEELLRDSAIRGHRQRVNDMRLEMGYAVLPVDPGLYGLGVQPGWHY